MEKYPASSCAPVELAKDWRQDRYLRKLEAMMIVCDADHSLILSGTGDVLDSDDGILAIDPAATSRLALHAPFTAWPIRPIWMLRTSPAAPCKWAGDICVYTNHNVVVETIEKA